ncbi:hypothetical protein LPJ63_001739 [Coemansia sp. RSA 2711]|nr:hypothetical protein LPJ63_001739 [Coemansia sp. RSA 2711]
MAASEQQKQHPRNTGRLRLAVDGRAANIGGDTSCGPARDGSVTPTGSKPSRPACIPLTSPTLLSPPGLPRRSHSTRRQTLQSSRHARQQSMAPGPRSTFAPRSLARMGQPDADPPRLSLDSQRAAISHSASSTARRHGVDGNHAWSSGQPPPSHTRGESCPTLDITRIMRSISVSSSSAPKAAWQERAEAPRHHSAPIEAPPPDSTLAAMLSPLWSDDGAHAAPAGNRNSLETGSALLSQASLSSTSKRHSVFGTPEGCSRSEAVLKAVREHNNGCGNDSSGLEHSVAGDAEPQALARPGASGLRRRISVRQRETGTPDIVIDSDFMPLSPPPSEGRQSFLGEGAAAVLSAAQSRPHSQCVDSPSSSRRCTISGEGSHKRDSRRSALIAATLRELESGAADDALDSALADKCEEETMTITLKGPRKREGEDGAEAPVPAVYLDGAASLWDHYVAELESSDHDPNIHLKRQRVGQLLRVPWNVEKLLWFGVAICFDALLHVFAVMPARFVRATTRLATGAARDMPRAVEGLLALDSAQTIVGALPAAWSRRVAELGGRMRGQAALQAEGGGATRWLSPAQLFDFYRGLLLAATCVVLCRIDAAQMYHAIRAQSSLKLYFIFSALDIFDRLLATFGHDALDALQSTVSDAWTQRWRTGAGYLAIAQVYMLVHTLVMFCQVITLNVAVNAYSDHLLSLLISVQFVEIKSTVFKKWEKEMLFQVSCADIVERFQAIVFLFIIIVRNMAELAGTGFSPLFGTPSATATSGQTVTPTAQPPVSFAAATPPAFGPLVPAWLSAPTVNRILTPVLMVLGSELLIDWIKHAFVTKLNWIRPNIYSHYIDVLSRDLACSRSGAASRVVAAAATTSNDDAAGALLAAAPTTNTGGLDEKIDDITDEDGYQHVSARSSSSDSLGSQHASPRASESSAVERPRARSASILSHAVFKVVAWMQASGGNPELAHSERRSRHRRTQSTTRPQLFVDQSSRVARRLGLAPLPLACMIMLMLRQVVHILISSSRAHHAVSTDHSSAAGGLLGWRWVVGWITAGWTALDIIGWAAIGLIAYALLVWGKLAFSSRLMQFAWVRYRAYERRTGAEAVDAANLKRFDDATKKVDRDDFFEPGRLINREPGEAEWEQQRPKWTMDNIERYSLFKSRIT